ncbi:MAG: alpha/beta hydrolase [Actinomycetota bacterium]
MAPASSVVLVHGGLGEAMDADRFWGRPGVVRSLGALGFSVAVPDRDTSPSSWAAGADALAGSIGSPSSVVAGSNGVSVAVRLALQHPTLVERLVLLWPATAGDTRVDAAYPAEVEHLLAGETLRGVTDAELATLTLPVAVMRSEPESRFHQHTTVEGLLSLLPQAVEIEPGFPEPPRPEFSGQLDAFVTALAPHL